MKVKQTETLPPQGFSLVVYTRTRVIDVPDGPVPEGFEATADAEHDWVLDPLGGPPPAPVASATPPQGSES